jgi:hypothetical protein
MDYLISWTGEPIPIRAAADNEKRLEAWQQADERAARNCTQLVEAEFEPGAEDEIEQRRRYC